MKHLVVSMYFKVSSWKLQLAVACCVGMLLFLFTCPDKTLANQTEQPDISISIIPATASFAVDNPTSDTGKPAAFETEIEVSNLTTNTLKNVTLCWFTNASININNLPSNNCLSPLLSLAPTGQYVWTVDLTRTGFLEQQDTVQFRVNYLAPMGSQNALAQRYAFSLLTVQNFQPQSVQQVAQLTVLSSLGTVNDQQTGQMFLVIENKSNFELNVTNLITKGPNFVTFDPLDFRNSKPIHPLTIAPGQQITTAISITANGPVPTGTQTLVFEIGIQWIDSGQVQTGNLVANQQVNVGVVGVSEIVSLLQIPSLLVLPGFLIVATLLWLKKIIKSPINDILQVSLVNPEFWLLAITLSIAADLVYFLFTRHKFWVQYDLTDVVIIWFGSIVTAIVVDLIVVVVHNRIEDRRNWQLQQREIKLNQQRQQLIPTAQDNPVVILRKLHKQKLNLVCKYVKLKVDEEEKRVFLLEGDVTGKSECWVSPAILVRWKLSNEPSSLQDKFNDILGTKNANDLADFLEHWQNQETSNQQGKDTQSVKDIQPDTSNQQETDKQSDAIAQQDKNHHGAPAPLEQGWKQLKNANGSAILIGSPQLAKIENIVFGPDYQFIVEQEFLTVTVPE